MKILLIFSLLIASGYLWYDDNWQKSSLKQVRAELDGVTQERDQAQQELATLGQGSNLNWLQKHVQGRGHPLDAPSYNQQFGVAHAPRIIGEQRVYQTDANGKYWVDQNGTRHSY